jgi:hypothetical protein
MQNHNGSAQTILKPAFLAKNLLQNAKAGSNRNPFLIWMIKQKPVAGYLLLVPSWLSLAGYLLTLRVCDYEGLGQGNLLRKQSFKFIK